VTQPAPNLSSDADKQALADLFSTTSAAHDSVGGLFAHFGALLVERAALGPGDRVLDVAAGAGASLIAAARRVGASGRVIGLDIAPGMVARLRALIEDQDIENADALVGDAESLPFDDEHFDTVLCGFGLFFFVDTRLALTEIKRVLRTGGCFAVSTFTRKGSDSMDATWTRIGAFTEVPVAAERERRFDERSHLVEALAGAGFDDVEVTESPFEVVLPDTDAWINWMRTMEFGPYLARMTPETLDQFRRLAIEDFARRSGGPEVRFPMDAYLTLARKPASLPLGSR
jgi:O-methyltransferase/aklanonic acid methyltransferase